VSRVCKRSIAWALEHKAECIDALLARETRSDLGLDRALLERYLTMYANEDTLEAAPDVRHAIDLLYARAHAAGHLDRPVRVELAS
jgi:predicted solute-binding protein